MATTIYGGANNCNGGGVSNNNPNIGVNIHTHNTTNTHTAVPVQIKGASSSSLSSSAISVNGIGTPISLSSSLVDNNNNNNNNNNNGMNGNNCGNKRGHIRSASLENANILMGTKMTTTTLGLPLVTSTTASSIYIGHTTGTLKSRNEQKRIRNKYGSYSNLDDVQTSRGNSNYSTNNNVSSCSKFQNIRHMFEFSKSGGPTNAITTVTATMATSTAATISANPTTNINKNDNGGADVGDGIDQAEQQMQSLPATFVNITNNCTTNTNVSGSNGNKYQTVLPATVQTQSHFAYVNNYQQQHSQSTQQCQNVQLQQCAQAQHASPLTRKPTPTIPAVAGNNSNRTNTTELNERLNIMENLDYNGNMRRAQYQQQQQQQQQQLYQHYQHHRHGANARTVGYGNSTGTGTGTSTVPSLSSDNNNNNNNSNNNNKSSKYNNTMQQSNEISSQRSISDLAQVDEENRHDQVTNLLRPIAFKPIPFEPDYSISNRYYDMTINSTNSNNNNSTTTTMIHSLADRYGSTPSLAALHGSNLRFGSTSDLRYSGIGMGFNGVNGITTTKSISMTVSAAATDASAATTITTTATAAVANMNNNNNIGGIGLNTNGSNNAVGLGTSMNVGMGMGMGFGMAGGYSSNNYCNNLMTRRRGSRSLKINGSMESIRHTPDSEANNQSGTLKSNCGGGNTVCNNSNSNNNHHNHNANINNNNSSNITVNTINGNGNGNGNVNSNSKYLSCNNQCDMTPSPSDSGISELEAALKDRDSELSYLRQAMEQNEKDKETFWENETKRLRNYYEGQQREFLLKIKKLEQMLAMQQFQFKQNKLRYNDQTNKLREQVVELKNECEILKTTNITLKSSERNLKDRSAYIEEQLEESQATVNVLKTQLEESEWKVCERNGELALLKNQLKEANNELTLKEHAIVHLKHENINNIETQIYQSLQDNQKLQQQQQQQNDEIYQTNRRKVDNELRQLNKIIILKDQVILALTNELAKLRKELSDLAIFHEYGEEPSGKYTRLKQQLDNLTDICNKTRQHTQQRVQTTTTTTIPTATTVINKMIDTNINFNTEKVLDDINLELIMNCLKTVPVLDHTDEEESHDRERLNININMGKHLSDLPDTTDAVILHNLPDIAVSGEMSSSINYHDHHQQQQHRHHQLQQTQHNSKFEESTLDTLIEESNGYAEQIAQLRRQLEEVRINFELEKRQWSLEKEKVLQYQKQLQTHYFNMYQKLRNLEKTNEV